MNRKILLFLVLANVLMLVRAQESERQNAIYLNSADLLFSDKPGLSIGGYGEVHYNQPLVGNQFDLGTLDLHRMVVFLGYNFTSRTQFVSEIEFEYAKELWVEQMFLQHKLNKFVSLRAGLLLIPMGIINEYHEPVSFNGVERPVIDNRIAPTTWREIGIGLAGNILPVKTKYQLYLVNGFNGFDAGAGLFSGSKALREGRQKGSKAYITSPAYSGKLEFYGIMNLNIGLSGYIGNSQSRLLAKVNKDSVALVNRADSSIVGISMIGLDARYSVNGIKLTGQLYYTSISNTEQYNVFTASNGKNNDLGSAMIGYYAEIGYNVLRPFTGVRQELMPFIRVEAYNTHHRVKGPVQKNKSYNNQIITTGLTFKLTKGAVIKADIQFAKSETEEKFNKVFNAGFGIMF